MKGYEVRTRVGSRCCGYQTGEVSAVKLGRASTNRSAITPVEEHIVAKKIVGYIKLQVPAGKANPSPPIGPALGQRGLNIMEFCKAFNAQTQKMEAACRCRS